MLGLLRFLIVAIHTSWADSATITPMGAPAIEAESSQDGELKKNIRTAGERDFVPALERQPDEAADGADRVRSAEGIGLFQGVEESEYRPSHGSERGKNGNGGDGPPDRDPWLKEQLAIIQRTANPGTLQRAAARARDAVPNRRRS
jgi:hypothetical protein